MCRIAVRSQVDVERARRAVRGLARDIGFGQEDVERVALAATELATNLVRYARGGELVLSIVNDEPRGQGVEIVSSDIGPGIPDLDRALEDGFSTGGGLGGGLGGVGRLMDECTIRSGPDGTHLVARKWPTPRSSSR
jgi:serine/threonine-protein kinase RsbT